MAATRKVWKILDSQPTLEGAGVRLRRAFGFREVPAFDPFLLLDDFRGENPRDYIAGFPWHPHRGIETITYVLSGRVEHGDSLGNQGVIGPGDVQWMTAGSGIIHQEMPKGEADGRMGGFHLWANLPAAQKMMDPRYREVTAAQIPVVQAAGGVRVHIIAGEVEGARGPVQDVVTDPEYLDVELPAGAEFTHPTAPAHTVFAYVVAGRARFGAADGDTSAGNRQLVLLGDGARIVATTAELPARFLLVSGKPIGEPVAWHGPIVMNTRAELQTAIEELEKGTFIKHR
jgi:redox-sensitive bicupin YhaK (pirin superfamily)